ncbi:MAG: hypothetical protein ACK5OC_14015 [Pirellula sp.]|jgi:hypothetical protein
MTTIESTLFYLDSFSTTEQQTVISNVGEIEPEVGPRDIDNSIGVSGGQHIVVPIDSAPEGALVGSTGAGPCIGLIVHDNDNIYVFHFAQTTDVSETIDIAIQELGDDAHAAIFGGDGSALSEQTLEEVMDYLHGNPEITIDGYADTPGLWIDVDGVYHINEVEANAPDDNQAPYIPSPYDPSDAITEAAFFH